MGEQLLNLYGDLKADLACGHGSDISSQRTDDLDNMALELIGAEAPGNDEFLALDFGCGAGGMTFRMAQKGARVVGVDLMDMSRQFALSEHRARSECPGLLWKGVSFVQADMAKLSKHFMQEYCGADLLLCQRAIHYLPWKHASFAVSQFHQLLKDGASLFISASGIGSELSDGYAHKKCPPEKRFAKLAPEMADKHGIEHPVCLYSEQDLRRLLEENGFEVTALFSSAFGNIKAVARKLGDLQ